MVLSAALVFLGIHVLPSTPLRAALIRRIGEGPYRGLFALLSAAALIWLVIAYRDAPVEQLWPRMGWTRWLALVVMPIAFFLFVGGVTVPNPGIAGMEHTLGSRSPATGILTITRHPLFWSFALWGAVHLLARGDRASVIFFGSLTLLALAGMWLIDRRKRDELGTAFGPFLMRTSAIPFVAALQGRTAIDWRGIGWWRPLVAVLLFGLFHIFGLSPFPW